MTEKIGAVKNPLTVIAIFAGIAEVSGTVVLPFVSESNQNIFIYFLMGFPTILVLLFFVVLIFKNKALYAPSDYKDEENYFRVTKYDSSKQEQVVVKVANENQAQLLYEQYTQLNESISNKIKVLESKISKSDKLTTSLDKGIYDYQISNLRLVDTFITLMDHKGYLFEIYNKEEGVSSYKDHKAIWLGKNIPFEISKEIIIEAKKMYPHLEYIHISGDLNDSAPVHVHNQIYIGGATESAIGMFNLSPIAKEDFALISTCVNNEELYELIREYYPN